VCLACFERSAGGAGGAGGGRGPRCGCCDRPGPPGRPCPNGLCARADRGWSFVVSVGAHAGALRRVVAAYKYRSQRRWEPVLAALLAGVLTTHATWFEELDLLVPVPAYLGPGARRGWDPVGALFAAVADRVAGAWDAAPGAVTKVAETPAMQGRRGWERSRLAESGLRPALTVSDPARVAGRRVLVVDDVLTGGSTLREVALALQGAGVAEVGALVLARRAGEAGLAPAGTR
jgi:predicted amidophosphoribosyltransferase